MAEIERRALMKGAALGALAFTVGGATVMLTTSQAHARNVPFRLLKEHEAEAIEAIGETLVPGARNAGVAHFIDQQLSVPPGEALLEARILNVRPPYANFYRAALGAIDRASKARHDGRRFAELSAPDQREFIDLMQSVTAVPSEPMEREELQKQVQTTVTSMPEHLREILLLSYFHQFPYKQISEILDIPLGTVKSRLHAAVAHFADRWRAGAANPGRSSGVAS